MKKKGRKSRSLQKKNISVQEDKELNAIIKDIENLLQEDDRITFNVCDTEIKVDKSYIDAYQKMGINLTEQYVYELWNYHSVYYGGNVQLEILKLINNDLSYKYLFLKNGLGNIIYFNSQGKPERYFDNFIEFYNFSVTNSNFTYGFEKFYKEGIRVTRSKIKFFGIVFLPLYDQMSWKNLYITSLIYWIRWIKRWEKTKAKKFYEDPFFKDKIGDISFHEYCQQKLKNHYFSIGNIVSNNIREMNRLRSRIEMDEKEYVYEIDSLLNRYAYNGKFLFEKVECLADYKNNIGIYMLCLHDIRGIYIGQTRSSISARITKHWSEPSSNFDCTFGPNDVNEIYVIKVPLIYLNAVEMDCIASIKEKYILNALRGGEILDSVHSQMTKSEDYLLEEEHLKLIKEKILLEIGKE
ncbi:MAG: hypothetical protein PHX08_06290 [Lachnospiraceae bacterium]|nr:hypothetical protein [Lachnospiraceae bacterium]